MTVSKVAVDAPMTLDDFATILEGQLRRVVAGETTPAVANAAVNLVATRLRIVKMVMDYAKQTGRAPSIPLLESKNEAAA